LYPFVSSNKLATILLTVTSNMCPGVNAASDHSWVTLRSLRKRITNFEPVWSRAVISLSTPIVIIVISNILVTTVLQTRSWSCNTSQTAFLRHRLHHNTTSLQLVTHRDTCRDVANDVNKSWRTAFSDVVRPRRLDSADAWRRWRHGRGWAFVAKQRKSTTWHVASWRHGVSKSCQSAHCACLSTHFRWHMATRQHQPASWFTSTFILLYCLLINYISTIVVKNRPMLSKIDCFVSCYFEC